MKRNLESRVEVLTPVDDPLARKKLRVILDLQLASNRDAWTMQSEGTYVKTPADLDHIGAQQAITDLVETRGQEFSKMGKKRRKGYARRHVDLVASR
jgi:polyphosphate kinase